METSKALQLIGGLFLFGFGSIGWAVAVQLSKQVEYLERKINKFYGIENKESESFKDYLNDRLKSMFNFLSESRIIFVLSKKIIFKSKRMLKWIIMIFLLMFRS